MPTPTQEHYLKRELLRLEVERELLLFNDPWALRKFGFPFSPTDPKTATTTATTIGSSTDIPDEFPLAKFFFTEFVLTIPFIQLQDHREFWVKKVQVFYENFMSMSMSESLDRDELTKRKKMGKRIQRLLVMMYNSGIGTLNELDYYTTEKSTITGGTVAESKRIQRLLFPSKETLQDHLTNGVFLNGINVNVCGVRRVQKLNNKFLSGLNITRTHDTHFEFLIKTRVDLQESETVWVSRRYKDFKELHQKLKKKYPGKQLPKLPSKVKSMVNVGSSNPEDDEEEELDEDELQEEEMNKKHDEEIRRNLTSLFKDLKLETADDVPPTPPKTPVMESSTESKSWSPSKNFFKSPKLWKTEKKDQDLDNKLPREKTRVGLRSYLRELLKEPEVSHSDLLKEFLFKGKIIELTNEDKIDIQIRENLDLLLLLNQVKFQREAYDKITQLKKESLPLRAMLLESDDGILKVFEEFKHKEHINELSPMLKNFIDWSKVEIAATIYQMFLGSDNSYEVYSQVRRLHKLMPYGLMINVLKFTNPMSIIKTMLDLLMASPFGGKSLLQTLFYGILSDDIKSHAKVITELETKIAQPEIIQRLKFFVYDSPTYDVVQGIKQEAQELKVDLLLTLIISPKLAEFSTVDDELIGRVFESYNEYKKLKQFENDPQELEFVNHEKLELYSDLKSLFKLYVRNRDKEIMQQLWSEPELTSILKEVFTMFYQPLVNLFSRAHVDVAFKKFENFMDDLVAVLDRLTHEMYTTDTSKIVDDIMKCLERHEDSFYQFIHDVYLCDKDGLFDRLIAWINGILKFLRHAKEKDPLKQPKRVDFSKMDVTDETLKEVDQIVEGVKRQHEEYQKKLKKQEEKKFSAVEDNWDVINNVEIFQSSDFGINEHDVIEFDDEDDDGDAGSVKSVEEKNKPEVQNENIKKLLDDFKAQVIDVLKSYV